MSNRMIDVSFWDDEYSGYDVLKHEGFDNKKFINAILDKALKKVQDEINEAFSKLDGGIRSDPFEEQVTTIEQAAEAVRYYSELVDSLKAQKAELLGKYDPNKLWGGLDLEDIKNIDSYKARLAEINRQLEEANRDLEAFKSLTEEVTAAKINEGLLLSLKEHRELYDTQKKAVQQVLKIADAYKQVGKEAGSVSKETTKLGKAFNDREIKFVII